jgi:hypothetical protein
VVSFYEQATTPACRRGLAYLRKYADRPSFLPIAVRALAYFEDAEQQPMPRLLTRVRWSDVRAYCEAAACRLARRLSGLD